MLAAMLQALIFDVDGTLADTERDGHRVAFNAAFRQAGLGWHWDVAAYGELLAVTGGKERIMRYIQRSQPDWLTQPDLAERVRTLHDLKTAHYLRLVASGQTPLRPGVATILAAARAAGLQLAIATTTRLENVNQLLTATLGAEAITWFAVIGAGDVVAEKKPAPDIYYWVLERLHRAPEQCLALEDSAAGLAAARAAGVPTVITLNEYTRDQDFHGAVKVLPDLSVATLAQLSAWQRDWLERGRL